MSRLELRVPGDKSIAHRALILGALARGESRLSNLPEGADVASTLAMMRAFGADIERDGAHARVGGRGAAGLGAPAVPVDCGNSGTTARLGIGLAAALPGTTTFVGDASLGRRPMERVVDPLRRAGAAIEYLGEEGRLPLAVTGGALTAMHEDTGSSSAQVKSALLLAAIAAGVEARLGVAPSRDHTERMLRAMGLQLDAGEVGAGETARSLIRARPPYRLIPLDLELPGDLSSAAFLLAAALLAGVPLVLRDVGVNPGRTGFLDIVRRMGAAVTLEGLRERAGEPVADVRIEPSSLSATAVGAVEAVRAIDELPLVAVLAAHAHGTTTVSGAGELRAKESDRIRAVCANLAALGVEVEERADGFAVQGTSAPLAGRVQGFGDHRIAMAFAVLGVRPGSRIEVDDLDVARISYPGFAARLEQLRAASPASIGGAG